MAATTIMAALLLAAMPAGAQESDQAHRWHISVLGGGIDFEGDEPLDDALLGTLALGYDLSPRWTLEGVVEYCPELESTYRHDWATGERISRLGESAGRDLTETSALRFAVDGLLHLAPGRRFDPYLAAGLGIAAYENDFDERYETLLRAGGGLFANLSDRWALRLDSRAVVTGTDTEVNLVTTAGLVFSFGGAAAATGDYVAAPAFEAVKKFVLYLNFDPGKAEIKSEYRSELDVIGRLLESNSRAKAWIEGHEKAGEAGAEQESLLLSGQRAQAVGDYLKANWGIRAARLTIAGLGTTRPAEGPAAASERIEVHVTLP
jgi:OOP family OmpA-OmpF porin